MIGVTGSGGVLGRAFRALHDDGAIASFDGDIRDAEATNEWVRSRGLTAIIHLAAIVPVRRVENDPAAAFAVNAGGTLNLCEAIRRHAPQAWLFAASSSHVYTPSDEPVAEDADTAPHSLYGLTKLHGEQIALAWARRFDLAVCVGRIFSFGAAAQGSDYLFPSLASRIASAAPNATIEVRGGHQRRDFLSVPTIVRAIEHLRQRRATGIVNIGSGSGRAIADVARALADRTGRRDVRIVSADESRGSLVANIGALQALGFTPPSDFDELLSEFAPA